MNVRNGKCATFDSIGGSSRCMDVTEWIKFGSDYGFIPKLFSVNKMKQIFTASNIGEDRDDRRAMLSFAEFEYAIKRCIEEAFAKYDETQLDPGVVALWQLFNSRKGDKSSRATSIMGSSVRSTPLLLPQEGPAIDEPEGTRPDQAAAFDHLRREIQERFEVLVLLGEAQSNTDMGVLAAQAQEMYEEIRMRLTRMAQLGAERQEVQQLHNEALRLSKLEGPHRKNDRNSATTKSAAALKIQSCIRGYDGWMSGSMRAAEASH